MAEGTNANGKERAILAYSGGLDTSVCIKWLQENKDLDIVALVGDVGQEHGSLEEVKQRALDSGAIDCLVVDMRQDYADDILAKALAANALYENKYPLLSALSRPIISKHLVNAAHEYGAKYIAHGCTGKGNDQVRFETSVLALDPTLERDLGSRESEMAWARERGVPVPTTNAKPYSIDDNVWGRAIECGVLENPWNEPPDDIWTMTVSPMQAPDEPTYVDVDFEAGIPVAGDGARMSVLDVIYKMKDLAGSNGFGRLDIMENRLVGVKSRECYEVPGSLSLIVAHKALEDMVLERDLLHYKLGAELTWADQVYNSLYYSPLKIALDGFFAETQRYVTGTVRLRFYKGNCDVVGVKSGYSLYDHGLATYDDSDTFNHDSAKGFIDLFGLRNKVWSENRHAMDAVHEQLAGVAETKDEFAE